MYFSKNVKVKTYLSKLFLIRNPVRNYEYGTFRTNSLMNYFLHCLTFSYKSAKFLFLSILINTPFWSFRIISHVGRSDDSEVRCFSMSPEEKIFCQDFFLQTIMFVPHNCLARILIPAHLLLPKDWQVGTDSITSLITPCKTDIRFRIQI